MTKIYKLGMYGEMPIVKVGKMNLSMFTDKENEDRIFLQDGEYEGMEVNGSGIKSLEKVIKEWFDKNF